MSLFEQSSLPSLLLTAVKRSGFKGVFYRVGDKWEHYSSHRLQEEIFFLTVALKKAGVCKGVGVGIIAPSQPLWIMFDVAAQICGAHVVPLFPNISSEHFSFQVKDSNVKTIIIDSFDALSEPLKNQIFLFEHLLHFSPLPDNIQCKNSILLNDFLEIGKAEDNEDSRNWFIKRVIDISPDEIFSIIYTSGSTGTPKGVPLTHNNIITHLKSLSEIFPLEVEKDVCMSVLPVAHIFERAVIYYFFGCGVPTYFADSPNNVGVYLPEIRPSILTVVPRILEKLYEKLVAAPEKYKSPLKFLVKYAIKKAKYSNPEKVSLRGTMLDRLVYSKMRAALGDNFKLIVSGSSALNLPVNRFLRNIGLPIFEGYGMTECSPVIAAENLGAFRIGSVGKPISCVTAKISEENEILVKGSSVFKGYHNRPDLNAEIFTEDGYFRTGDKGRIDQNGFIWITGRLKEMFKTSTGKYVSPVAIEQMLCRSTFIEAAQIFAEGRKFVSAIIFMNADMLALKLNKKGKVFNHKKALESKRINSFLRKHIEYINSGLNEWERIKKWKAVIEPLSTENGLLTPTFKLRRTAVENRFSDIIKEMYEA